MDKLELVWKMNHGSLGCDESENTPLARAVRQLFKDGKLFSNLSMCFFKDVTGTLRWLGAFVQTIKDKIVYFPGFENEFDKIQGIYGKSLQWNQSFNFCHFTLEKDHSKWHVTSRNSKHHRGSPQTLSLGNSRTLWLGLSIADAEVMRIAKRETKISIDAPNGQGQRRLEAFRKAREGASFLMASLDHPVEAVESFMHFTFIVGQKGFEDYSGGELGLPYENPFLARPLPQRLSGLPSRTHRLELSDSTDIQITVCRLPGSLKTPVVITGQSQPISI